MAGNVNDVAGYAPAGYRLERTDYEGGAAHHRFVCEGKPELVCTVGAHEDERSVLSKFQAALAPKLAVTEPAPATEPVAVMKPAAPTERALAGNESLGDREAMTAGFEGQARAVEEIRAAQKPARRTR